MMRAASRTHVGRPIIWEPNTGPQTQFLECTAREVLYGGAKGGGKTAAIVAYPLYWANNPHFRFLVLRRDTTQLANILDQARRLYRRALPGTKIVQAGAGVKVRFPSGAEGWFNHCEHEKNAGAYDGHEYQLIQFDELTHFSLSQYRQIRTSCRSSHAGLPRYTRCTTNPGSEGHEWVFARWAPWLNPTCEVEGLPPRFNESTGARLPPARPGQVLWYLPVGDNKEEWVPRGTPGALSRTFIPALAKDNPHLLDNDPDYLTSLQDLDPVRRAQLVEGNWLVKPAAGLYFKRQWWRFLQVCPMAVKARVRYWDLAGSTKATKKGDYAAGCRMSLTDAGLLVVEHVTRSRGTPGETRALVRSVAETDGRETPIVIEQDPGQAGADQALTYAQLLMGWSVTFRPKRVDKITAAGPFSAQVQANNAALVGGVWNDAFIAELESFPDGDHDDQVDAASGAFACVLDMPSPPLPNLGIDLRPRTDDWGDDDDDWNRR